METGRGSGRAEEEAAIPRRVSSPSRRTSSSPLPTARFSRDGSVANWSSFSPRRRTLASTLPLTLTEDQRNQTRQAFFNKLSLLEEDFTFFTKLAAFLENCRFKFSRNKYDYAKWAYYMLYSPTEHEGNRGKAALLQSLESIIEEDIQIKRLQRSESYVSTR